MEMAVKIGTVTFIDKTGEARTTVVESKDFLFGTSSDCDVRLHSHNDCNEFGVIKTDNEKACIYGLNGISVYVNEELVLQEGKLLNKGDIIRIFEAKFEWQYIQEHRTCSRSLPIEKKQDGYMKRLSEPVIPTRDEAENVTNKKQSENLETEDLVDVEDHLEVTTPKVSKIMYSSASCEIDRSQECRNQVKRLVNTENKKKNSNRKSKILINKKKTKLAYEELSAANKITGTLTKKDSIVAKKSLMSVSPFNMSNVFLSESKVNQENEVEINEKSTTNLAEKIMDDELNLNHGNIIGKPCHSTPKPNIELKRKLKNIDHSSLSSSTNLNYKISANEKSMEIVEKKSNSNSLLCESSVHELSVACTNESNAKECALTPCEESGDFNLQITAYNLSKIEKKRNSKVQERSEANETSMGSVCASKSANTEKSTPGKRSFVSFSGESENRRNTRGRSSMLRKTFEENLCDDESKEKSLTTPEKTADCTLSKMFHESSIDILDPKLDPKLSKNSKSELTSISEDNDTCERSFIDKYKMCVVVKNNSITPVARCARNLSYISPPENNRSQEFMDSVVSTPKKSVSDNEYSEMTSVMSPTKESTFLDESEGEIISRKRRSTGFTPLVGTPSNEYRVNRKISTPYTGSWLSSSEFDSDKSRVRTSERRSTPFKANKTRKSSIRDSLNVHPPILENSSLEQEDEDLGNENNSIFKFVTTRRRRRFGENSFAEDNKILEESEVKSDSSMIDDQSSFSEPSYEESTTTMSMRTAVNASEEDDAEDLLVTKFSDSNLKSILTPIPKRMLLEKEKSTKKVTFDLPESPECSINFSRQLEMDDDGFTMISDKIDRSSDYSKSDISNSSYSNLDFGLISDVSGSVNDSLSVNHSVSELSDLSMKNESSSVNIQTEVKVRASLLDVSGVEQIETSRKISLDRLKNRRSSAEVNLSGVKELLKTPETLGSSKKKKSLRLNKIAGVSSLTKNDASRNNKKPKRFCKSLNLNEVETVDVETLKNISKVKPSPRKVKVASEQSQDDDSKNANQSEVESSVSKREIPEIIITESSFIDVDKTLNTEYIAKGNVEVIEKAFIEDEPNIESNVDVTNEPKNVTVEENSLFGSSPPNTSQIESILDEEDEFETSDQYESVFSDDEENEPSSISTKSKLEISSNAENGSIQESSLPVQLVTSKIESPDKNVNNDSKVESTTKKCHSFTTPEGRNSVASNVLNSSIRRCRKSSRLHKNSLSFPNENSVHECSITSAETTTVENEIRGNEQETTAHKLFKHVIDELKTNLAEKKSAVDEDEEELAKKLNDSTEGELETNLSNIMEKEVVKISTESAMSNRNDASDLAENVNKTTKIEKESNQKVNDSVEIELEKSEQDEVEKKLAEMFDYGIQTESKVSNKNDASDLTENVNETSKIEKESNQKVNDSVEIELEKSEKDEVEKKLAEMFDNDIQTESKVSNKNDASDLTENVNETSKIEKEPDQQVDDLVEIELEKLEKDEVEKKLAEMLNDDIQTESKVSEGDESAADAMEIASEADETEEELAQKLDDSGQNELKKLEDDELETGSVENMRIEEDITLKLDDSIQADIKEPKENELNNLADVTFNVKESETVLSNSARAEFGKSKKNYLKTNLIETVDEDSETEEELAQKLDDSIETKDSEEDELLFECPNESMTELINEKDKVREDQIDDFVEDSSETVDLNNSEVQEKSEESNIEDMNDENSVIVEYSSNEATEVREGIHNLTNVEDNSPEITIEEQLDDKINIPETPQKIAVKNSEKYENNIVVNSPLVVDKGSYSEDLKPVDGVIIAELLENKSNAEKTKLCLTNVESFYESTMVQEIGETAPTKDLCIEILQKNLVERSRNETVASVAEVSVETVKNNSVVQQEPDQSIQPTESTTANPIPNVSTNEFKVLTVKLVRSPIPNEKDDRSTKEKPKLKRKINQPKAFEEKVTRNRRKNKETKVTTKTNYENLLENNEIQNDKENLYSLEVMDSSKKRKRKLSTAENIVAEPEPISIVKDVRKSRRLRNVENIESAAPATKQVSPKKERAKRVRKETKAKKTSENDKCDRCSVVLPVLSLEVVNSPVKVDENGKLTIIKEPAVVRKTRAVKAKKVVPAVETAVVTRQMRAKRVHFEDDSDNSQISVVNSVTSKPQRKSIRNIKSLESEEKPITRSKAMEKITESRKTRAMEPIQVEMKKPANSSRRKREIDDVEVPARKSSRKSVAQTTKVYKSTRKSEPEVKLESRLRKSVAAKNTVVKVNESEIVSEEPVTDKRKNTEFSKRTRSNVKTCMEPVVEIELAENPRKTRKITSEKALKSETKIVKNDTVAKVETKPVLKRKINLKNDLEIDATAKKLKIILNPVSKPVEASSSSLNGRKRKQDNVSVPKNLKSPSVKVTRSNRSTRNNQGPCSSTKSEDLTGRVKKSVVTSSRKISTDLKRKGKVSMTFKTSIKAGPSPLNRRVTRSRAKMYVEIN